MLNCVALQTVAPFGRCDRGRSYRQLHSLRSLAGGYDCVALRADDAAGVTPGGTSDAAGGTPRGTSKAAGGTQRGTSQAAGGTQRGTSEAAGGTPGGTSAGRNIILPVAG